MEITGLDTIQTVKKVGHKEAVQEARVEDTVAISAEAKKRAEWVDMLKQMPDVRPEKIAAALAHPPISPAELAQHMIRSGF